MSSFSGKCDFKDHIDIVGLNKVLKSTIYIHTPIGPVKLDLKNEEDLIPYYGHIITASVSNSSGSLIYLDRIPWISRQKKKLNTELFVYYRTQMNLELSKYGLPLKYSNEECTPGFFMKTKELGYLMDKEELLKYSDKLFICKDCLGNLYLLYNKCFKETFLISKTNSNIIENLLSKKCTLLEALINSTDIYIGEYNEYTDMMILKRKNNPLKIGKIHLPKENLYYNKTKRKLEP